MQGILYEEHSAWLFVLVTIVMGGAAAWQTGRSVAQTWRPFAILPLYIALLNLGVRFIHYALFGGMLLLAAAIGWRMRRAQQMRTQYSFAFTGSGPFSWKRKA
jgi:hypothetical protein